MNKGIFEKYIAFRKKLIFFTVFSVEKEKIGMQICKNVIYHQPYSTEWHDYIKNTYLQIYPKPENFLQIFRKLYNKKIIQKPVERAFHIAEDI